jgi:lipopolysaccharide biosynthesis glycosyltransferase
VACSIDRGWLPHLAAMLHSLLEHERSEVRVHVLAADLGEQSVADLTAMTEQMGGRLELHRPALEQVAGMPTFVPPVLWFRAFIAETLGDLDRVLSLDTDLLFMGPIRYLWRTEIGDNLLAAVAGVFPGADWGNRHCEPLGIRPDAYFNTGVMLLDLERMRREDLAGRISDFCRSHAKVLPPESLNGADWRTIYDAARERPDIMWNPEQDVTNAVVAGRWRELHPRWNCMSQVGWRPLSDEVYGSTAVEEALTNPAIRHCEGPGPAKPWHPDAEPEAARIYRSHRDRTPWPVAREPVA